MNKKISFFPALIIIILVSIILGFIVVLASYYISREIITTLPSLEEIPLEDFEE